MLTSKVLIDGEKVGCEREYDHGDCEEGQLGNSRASQGWATIKRN